MLFWLEVPPGSAAIPVVCAGVEAAQGATVTNPDYATQVTSALAAGLDIMPYVFADPGKVSDGGTQFSNGWNVINSVTGHPYAFGGQMLPIALDMEADDVNFPGEPCYGLDPERCPSRPNCTATRYSRTSSVMRPSTSTTARPAPSTVSRRRAVNSRSRSTRPISARPSRAPFSSWVPTRSGQSPTRTTGTGRSRASRSRRADKSHK